MYATRSVCTPVLSFVGYSFFIIRSEYDRGVNTFSPEGRLFQVEYALGAVKLGSTSVGIKTAYGVVLATERRIQSKLMLAEADVEKIREIDSHIGCASSGIIADARILIDHARVEAQHHHFTFDEKLPIESCVACIADLALAFSGVHENKKQTISRPFGVALLVAGVDDEAGPSLWCTDPSGTNTKYEAAAIGSAQEGAEALLQEKFHSNMTLTEAEDVALVVLRQVMEEKLTPFNVEVASIPVDSKKFHVYNSEEVKAIVDRLPEPVIPTAAATLNP